jgi:hypothetical protein
VPHLPGPRAIPPRLQEFDEFSLVVQEAPLILADGPLAHGVLLGLRRIDEGLRDKRLASITAARAAM